jgi:hypothetical protein
MKSEGAEPVRMNEGARVQIGRAAATLNLTEPETAANRKISLPMLLFIGLQGLDLLTTLAVFAHGGVELNPVVRILMPWIGRAMGVLVCKAVLVGVIWTFRRRTRVLMLGDLLYTGVVIWNVMILIALK